MVRLPATLVALALMLALNLATFLLTRVTAFVGMPIVLLPLWAAAGGCVAGRCGAWQPPVPGFAVGLLLVATQIGLASGYAPALREYVGPGLALLQVIAAITGGMIGALLARRANQPAAQPEYTAL